MRRVLLVDDSPALRSTVARKLEDLGWSVRVASDAEEALISALSAPPDAVITDLWMPGLSGLQLCQLLRSEPATAHIPVLLCTSNADRRSRFWAQRSGANAFIERRDCDALLAELERLVPPGSETSVPAVRGSDPGLRRSTIPARLSMLLDHALFEAVVVGELRSLAFDAADVDGLFQAFSQLMTDIVAYSWLALSVPMRHGVRVFMHQHPRHRGRAVPGGVQSVVAASDGPVELRVISDARVSDEPGDGPVTALPVMLRGRLLGRVGMGGARSSHGRDEVAVLTLAARELALPLHAVGLLEETRRLASTDALTGLGNRRAVSLKLDELARRDPAASPLSIALIDVDHFKAINDTYGHASGDRALCHIAEVLRAVARGNDLTARWGGEEFLLVLDGTSAATARVVAERVRGSIARTPCRMEDGKSLPMTVSIGVATFDGRGLDAFIDAADRALYRAKSRGRDRVEVAGEEAVTPSGET
jgi:two-component system, cell cycle response regulator